MIPRSLPVWLLAAAASIQPTLAQTSTKCNPLQGSCPADPALGKSTTIDFTSGQSSDFSESGSPQPSYDSNGVNLVVAQSGNSPTLTSNWFMMFGHVEVTMKAAKGVGIVSSMVLQSDDLDEVDFEWLGADGTQVQSNYFGKGQTTSYNRGAFHANPGNQDSFHTYTVDWTAEQVVWQIDGTTVRALTPQSAEANQYPQTPMQLKLGIWSGGDPSNPPGTIQWAGGQTQYSQGPFTMYIQSVKATDYSTGTQYTYSDTTGNWQSIKSNGGTISGSGSSAASSAAASAPSVTEVSSGAPSPFGGTHRDSSSTFETPSVWPWVASSTLATSVQTSIPGVPSGWTVTASGHVIPPSSAPSTAPPSPLSSSQPSSPQPSSPAPVVSSSSNAAPAPAPTGNYITTLEYNQQGFPTTITEPAAWLTAAKSYDEQGFQVLPTAVAAIVKDVEVGVENGAANAKAKIKNGAISIATSNVGSVTSSSSGTASSSSPSTTGSSSGSTTMSTSTTTTYAPPSSLNPTPMPIPTAMGAASGLGVRLWSVGLACGAVGFAVLMV
ncbi:hypothetical protein MMC10_005192 [Thelotrema lepadinum]|nr:hypothetical protein [Thelotrema lepadinum]